MVYKMSLKFPLSSNLFLICNIPMVETFVFVSDALANEDSNEYSQHRFLAEASETKTKVSTIGILHIPIRAFPKTWRL